MIVEHRCYQLHPGKIPKYLSLFELPGVLPRLLRNLRGFWIAESGLLNTVHHLWSYNDRTERTQVRQDMTADPAMRPFMKDVLPLLKEQRSCVLAGMIAEPEDSNKGGIFDLLSLSVAGASEVKDCLNDLTKTIETKAGIVTSLRGSALEGDEMVGSAELVLRHPSFAARDAAAPEIEGMLVVARDEGWLKNSNSLIMLPASFSPWK